ncbi:GNAT family N-acetyltransferase [Streptomyces misionensis]|uniref:GNAT family N-acetyltransferase n=1 Tax=Streptomyces misionensis TaxID=67331 RepID=UPI0034119211
MVTVRTMTAADVTAVAEIRVAGWRAAYAGLLPASYLDRMSVEENAGRLRERLARPGGSGADLVAVDARGTPAGWVCVGPAHREGGEVHALYVRPSRIGTGVGRALLDAANAHAHAHGLDPLALWVLAGNTRARRFYERAGYTADGAVRTEDYDGVAVREVRYCR